MEEEINKLLEKAMEIMGDDTDIMIITHKDGKCGAVLHGDTDKLAEGIFSSIHHPGPLGQSLYRIIKLNTMNLLSNPSPYAVNLSESIVNTLPESTELS